MIDIHSHLLFNVDDGSKSIENSVKIISDLREAGFTSIILTPHYIGDSNYESPRKHNLEILKELKDMLDINGIDIDLYLGNEIFIDYNILDLLKQGVISSLNGSRYLLIELPMSGEFEGYIEVFSELINRGYFVILAHPERYHSFQKDFNKVYELESIGVLFQSNYDSITGGYGKKAKKMVRRLLKEKKISFLGTDIHRRKKDYSTYKKVEKIALKYLTLNEYHQLIKYNASKVIKDLKLTGYNK